jgi:hypothetical protein
MFEFRSWYESIWCLHVSSLCMILLSRQLFMNDLGFTYFHWCTTPLP